MTAPEWAREQGNQRLNEVGPPGNPQDYANFLLTMIYRYPGQIHAIEVWNEMNLDREWPQGQINPATYVQMLAKSYTAIKAANASVMVISGAPSIGSFMGTAPVARIACSNSIWPW